MILIQEVLIEEDVLSEHFACAIDACKGACCWEGDYGAPLEDDELEQLDQITEKVIPLLPKRSQKILENQKGYKYYKGMKEMGTELHDDGACVYLTKDVNGIALCGIEMAWKAGLIDFRKPISCHLYPIRIEQDENTIFPKMIYDRWDICSAACNNGSRHKIKLYEFAKEAIIRKYGEDFYQMLSDYADQEEK